MFNNTTFNGTSTPVLEAPADYLIFFWIAYIVVGAPLSVLDSVSLLVMMKRHSARLGNLFLVGLSCADLINSVAMFVSGIFRLIYTLMGMKNELTSRFICFMKLVTLWLLATEMTAFLLIFSSLDR